MVPSAKTDYKTFAVKVKAVRADWIIKDMVHGISFLQEMVRHKNKDVFNTDYAKIITQYLYKEYSGNLIKQLLPTYIIHQIFMIIYLFSIERLRIHIFFYHIEEEEIKRLGMANADDYEF